MKSRYGILTAILASVINSTSIAGPISDEIVRLQNNNDYLGACKLRVELAKTKNKEANYYAAADCAYDLPVLGVDIDELIQWLKIGTANGYPGAFRHLGEIYENAKGVDGNIDAAVIYYEKAIERSDNIKYNDKLKMKVESLKLQKSCSIRTTNVFDTFLKCSNRKELNKAIQRNGGILLSVKPTSMIYESVQLLEGSDRLEVFYSSKNDIFSCMKYTFGLFTADQDLEKMRDALVDKYGAFDEYNGNTNNDRNTMTWSLEDGIVVTLKNQKLSTTLEYCLPAYENIRSAEIKNNLKISDSKRKSESKAY